MKNSLPFITSLYNEAAGLLILLLLWGGLTLFYPAYIVPTPWAVLTGISAYLPTDFLNHAGITFVRTLLGFGLAISLGTLCGIVAYLKKWAKPMNSFMLAVQVLPGTILGVIFLLMFGLGSAAPILLVTFLTLPAIAVNTVHGLAKRDLKLESYLKTLSCGRWDMLRYLYLPALVPVIESNLSLGLGLSIKMVIMGEFIGAQDGLGFLLNNARIFLNMKEVFFYLVFIMLVALVFQGAQSLVFGRFFRKYYFAV
jgi:NitT/TauT family transport system permease protein